MAEQTYKNHTRWHPVWHFIVYPLILATIVGAGINLYDTCHDHRDDNLYSASLIFLISFLLLVMAFYSRLFALKAQDRAIRAEENFRHFILTGKPLPATLRVGQIVALRFASDNEFPELVQMANQKNMNAKAIKEAIKSWKADYDRV